MTISYAVKRLTRSDLTFFRSKFLQVNAGNQKSINLNRDVFIDRLFPGLPALADEVPVRLTVLGPGGAGAFVVTRKILKKGTYKNWRLNGEVLPDPDREPGRFGTLDEGDLVLFAFEGVAQPTAVTMALLSASSAADSSIYSALDAVAPARMGQLSVEQVESILAAAPGHPAEKIAPFAGMLEDLVETATGDAVAAERVVRRSWARPVSRSDLEEARRLAAEIGYDGEALVAEYLSQLEVKGVLQGFNWTAAENAVSPFDFELDWGHGRTSLIEVKTTIGTHDRPIHMSLAEVVHAATEIGYELWRISKLDADGGLIRKCRQVQALASATREAASLLPRGVRADGFTIDPALFEWSEELHIRWDQDEDD